MMVTQQRSLKADREVWLKDKKAVSKCENCEKHFGVFRRRHHCRACGNIFCRACCRCWVTVQRSHYKEGKQKQKRVCGDCFKKPQSEWRSTVQPFECPDSDDECLTRFADIDDLWDYLDVAVPDRQTEAGGANSSPPMITPAVGNATSQKTLTFKPGPVGIDYDYETGDIFWVKGDGQGYSLGVRAHWKFVLVDGKKWTDDLWDAYSEGDADYTITFTLSDGEAVSDAKAAVESYPTLLKKTPSHGATPQANLTDDGVNPFLKNRQNVTLVTVPMLDEPDPKPASKRAENDMSKAEPKVKPVGPPPPGWGNGAPTGWGCR
jgi:hypothetical protein